MDKWLYSPDLGRIQVRDGHFYTEHGDEGPEAWLDKMLIRVMEVYPGEKEDYASNWEAVLARRQARIEVLEAAALDEKRYFEEVSKIVQGARAKLTEDEWVAICDYFTADYEDED